MKNRRTFLTALGLSGVSPALAGRSEASTDVPMPKATVVAKPPSAAALATALAMRRFDPKLTDAQIETIARRIDGNAAARARLNPKKKRLRNSDEPVTTFVVPIV